jgi:chromosome segregation ATPase
VNEKTAKRAALLEQEQAAKSELMEAKFDASEARTKAREAREDVEHATRELETWEAKIKEYQGYLQRCFERDHEWYESLTAAPVPSAVAESPDA